MAKKLALALGVLFGLVVLSALVVPLVVNVDDYRPQIERAANEHLNGKLTLGKLSLSLWGQIRVQVDGIQLTDAENRPVLSAKQVYFHVPVGSLLTGSPELTLKMQAPEVFVVKDKNGKLNVLSLVKESPPPSSAPSQPPTESKGGGKLPGIAMRARLGIEMRNALLSYADESTKLSSQVKDLDVTVRDLSLKHPTECAISATLDTVMGKLLTVRGPVKMSAKVTPKFAGEKFESADLQFHVEGSDLEILLPKLFEKHRGIVMNADGQIQLQPTSAQIPSLTLRFHNAEVKGSGSVTGLGEASGPAVDLKFQSNEVALKPWNALVPMLAQYDLGGSMSLVADAEGPTANLKYHAAVNLKAVTARAPQLKAEPRIDGAIKVATDEVQDLAMKLSAPGNDLRVSGKVVSFSKPRVDLRVDSNGMDLDQLVAFPQTPSGAAPAPAASSSSAKEAPANYDASLEPLRTNAIAAATDATVKVNLAFVKAKGIKLSPIAGVLAFRNLALSVQGFRTGVFGGNVGANATIDMRPRTPTYRMDTQVAGLDLQQAVASQYALFKNTLLGKLNLKMALSGASFNPEPAKASLVAQGNVRIDHPVFATLDIGRMATDALNRTVQGLESKIPALKNVKLPAPGSIESHYDSASSDFTIAGGRFSAPNFTAKAQPQRGIDVNGSTTVGMKDYALDARWQLVDTYNLTHARNLSVNVASVQVDHILADGAGPVSFPITVGGTVFQPAPVYTAVAEQLGRVALNNIARAAGNRAKAEVQKRLEDEAAKQIQKAAPNLQPALQNAAKDFTKKLFGN